MIEKPPTLDDLLLFLLPIKIVSPFEWSETEKPFDSKLDLRNYAKRQFTRVMAAERLNELNNVKIYHAKECSDTEKTINGIEKRRAQLTNQVQEKQS